MRKVFERQLSKEGLSGLATNEDVETAIMCKEDLRDLFALHEGMPSHLHHKIRQEDEEAACDDEDDEDDKHDEARALATDEVEKVQEGYPKETGDMHLWGHHLGCETVDDPILRDAGRQSAEGDGYVSFVFSLQVKGALKTKEDELAERRAELAATEAAAQAAPNKGGGFKAPARSRSTSPIDGGSDAGEGSAKRNGSGGGGDGGSGSGSGSIG